MKNKIIKTTKSSKRNKFISFLLSLAFTGLGQMYNGKLLQGAVFFIFRILSLLFIPVYAHYKPVETYVVLFFNITVFHFVISLASPFEAFIYALKNKKIPVKKYNSIFFYTCFAFINITLITMGFIILFSFFQINKFNINNSTPIFKDKDYILINKYNKTNYNKGELVIYKTENRYGISRIIAISGETVNLNNNSFEINGIPFFISTFNEEEMQKLKMDDYNDILSETNNLLKYPIKTIGPKEKIKLKDISRKIGKNELFIADDNRSNKNYFYVINKKSIIGRIEGVILSDEINRFLLKPFIKDKVK